MWRVWWRPSVGQQKVTKSHVGSIAELKVGDIIRHVGGSEAYVVTAHYGARVTAVRTVDVTNPNEWVLVWNPLRVRA